MEIIEFFLLGFTVLAFYACLEFKTRVYSLFSLLLGTVSIGLYYISVSITLVGLFHLLVYSGFITTVFLSVSFTSEEKTSEDEKKYE